jgi:hypothetical protein
MTLDYAGDVEMERNAPRGGLDSDEESFVGALDFQSGSRRVPHRRKDDVDFARCSTRTATYGSSESVSFLSVRYYGIPPTPSKILLQCDEWVMCRSRPITFFVWRSPATIAKVGVGKRSDPRYCQES